jgi:predicted phage terminase large subunit-like protein
MTAAPATEIALALPRLHRAQRRIRRERKRFNMLVAGRRFGKTKFGLDEIIAEPLGAIEGEPVAWFAPTFRMLSDPWRDCLKLFAPIITKADKVERRVEFIGGGSIDFWSLERPDRARGRKYRKIVVDEAAMLRGLLPTWREVLRPLLTDLRGSSWFMSTPKGANDFKAMFDAAANWPERWSRWQIPTSANPFIHPEEIAEARAELPELVFRQEYGAEFVDMAGLAVRREFVRYAQGVDLTDCSIGMGVDLAISQSEEADFFAIVVVAMHPDGRRFVVDAFHDRLTFYAQQQAVASMAAKWNPGAILIESQQYQAALVQELARTTTLPVAPVRADRDKLVRFAPMVTRYEQGLVYHAAGLPDYFESELFTFPGGKNDDLVDALGYADRAAMMARGGSAAVAGAIVTADLSEFDLMP